MINCLNYVRSVALNGTAFNPSWHLTEEVDWQTALRTARSL
jgi:hypothetical protein